MDITLLASTIRFTTPLLLAALGGLFSERAGVVNIALEGIMIFGALTAAVVAQQLEAPFLAADPTLRIWWVPWLATLAAALAGALIAWVHALVSIKYRADQVISGTAINLLGAGVPSVILLVLYGNTTDSKTVLNRLPLWGTSDFAFSPLTYLAFALVALTWYVMYRTRFGLRLRSVGEAPQASASVGVDVPLTRYIAVIASGVLAALAGAFLSIGNLDAFTRNLSANQGFIALAALIFGKWQPVNVLFTCLLFGAFKALGIRLESAQILPSSISQALPYVITIMVLAGFIGRSRAPKALGQPYP